MFESVNTLLAEHEELQQQLADPELHSNPARSKKVNRRYAELSRIVDAYQRWLKLTDDVEAATEMAEEDASFAEELPNIKAELAVMEERLRRLLIPRDPNDGRDVIMEIKMGEGGAESALFASDLLRMYLHFAESKKWKTEIIEQTSSDLGGIKDVQLAIKGNSTDPAEGVWAQLKYEGGVHRVQRVP
ncbi:MAG: prfA, partial [Microbacteriaceae bacterium]|nr:prfA [Microbacteriaceae bacterium]